LRWGKALAATVERAARNPGAGHLRQDLPMPGIRCLVVVRFPRSLLFYRWEKGSEIVELLRVKYGGMNLPALFWPT
jgi:plasmid stabilization system protein ParE